MRVPELKHCLLRRINHVVAAGSSRRARPFADHRKAVPHHTHTPSATFTGRRSGTTVQTGRERCLDRILGTAIKARKVGHAPIAGVQPEVARGASAYANEKSYRKR